ncbi:hypothetical protein LCGC14_1738780 [marine sediment metagenome]|uniref:Uncharacterized protein n=1 Tax=marine sediment metagenome TaxID=412755 RepID=A0A0F9HV01_9ZZZZ
MNNSDKCDLIVIGAGISGLFKPAQILKLAGPAIIAAATSIAAMFQSVLAFAMANPLLVAAVIAAIVAIFLIVKYRDQIWSGLMSLFDILMEFFTDALPAWFKQHFTAENIGRLVGGAAAILIIALFPIPFLIIKFRSQIMGFLTGSAGFVAGIPGKIAAFIGDHWKEIIGTLVDVPKWSVEFGDKAIAFVADVLPRIPGWFASIGTAIASAIKDAFFSVLDFSQWLKDALGAAWNKLPGPVKDFLGGVGGGFGAVMDWAGLQKGVLNFIGGMALVGEHGPELMRLPAGTDVVRNENMRQAIRDLDGTKPGGGFNLAVNVAANVGDWIELRRQILEDVEEHLDDAAARAGLSSPRFGTLGSGVPRT